jgi:hypothetical protein
MIALLDKSNFNALCGHVTRYTLGRKREKKQLDNGIDDTFARDIWLTNTKVLVDTIVQLFTSYTSVVMALGES